MQWLKAQRKNRQERTSPTLVVGLGNPGKRYQNTWHNLGSRVVQNLARQWGVEFNPGKGDCLIATRRASAVIHSLMIPTSYMNRSGDPVAAFMNYYKIPVAELLVILDDHDLPFGRIRIRRGGSSGGHRGLGDIMQKLGTNAFPRLRIGIKTDSERADLSSQVLSQIPVSLDEDVEKIIKLSIEAVEMIIEDGIERARGQFNAM